MIRSNRWLDRPNAYRQIPTGTYYQPQELGNPEGTPNSTMMPQIETFNWTYEFKKLHLTYDEFRTDAKWEIESFTSEKIEMEPVNIVSSNGSILIKTVLVKK